MLYAGPAMGYAAIALCALRFVGRYRLLRFVYRTHKKPAGLARSKIFPRHLYLSIVDPPGAA